MAKLQQFPLLTTSGRTGLVWRSSRFLDRDETNHIRLEDGTEFDVPSGALRVRPDGTILLEDSAAPSRVQESEPPMMDRRETNTSDAPPMMERRDMNPPAPPRERRETMPAAPPPAPQADVQPVVPPEARVEPASDTRSFTFNEPLFMEDVSIERVAVNRILDAPAQPRQEGDVTIVPVMEEVVTVQKRLMLREEVRITRRRTELREPRQIVMTDRENRVVGADGRDIDA